MGKVLLQKATGIGVALSLVLLIFAVLIPSASAVRLSPGAPNNTLITAGATIIFQDVNLTIRDAEAIPVTYLTFIIFNSTNNHKVAQVRFSLEGSEISETPHGAFTVVNVTNTSNLPYQSKGDYYGNDERTGRNITGFHHGFGYGYGYGTPDLTIVYTITYKTCKPGTYYAKLFVKATKYTYTSEETTPFTVLPKPPQPIFVDIKPGFWPNQINPRDHGYLQIAICGTNTFDIHTIDPRTLRLSLNGGKNMVKPLCYKYKDMATPWLGADGSGHSAAGDGYLDLILKFRIEQVIHVLKLFKHSGETLQLTLTSTLKKSRDCFSINGYDYIQITLSKHKVK
jgi:hypothetical protein